MKPTLFSFFLLLWTCTPVPLISSDEKPVWLEERPVSSKYYIGIGSADKIENELDYHQVAKDNALQDLSSEINVNISGEMVHDISEKAGVVEEDLRSQIRSSSKAFLEGFEQVGIWEDDYEYWVYYRLDKNTYTRKKEERLARAAQLGLDFYSKALHEEQKKNISSALNMQIQSLSAIQEFIAEPLEVELDGHKIILQNEMYSSMQALLNKIELKAITPRIEAQGGQPLPSLLSVIVRYKEDTASNINVSGLPIGFKFIRGQGNLDEWVRSDSSGQANCRVNRVAVGEKLQIIQAKLYLQEMLPEHFSELARNVALGMVVPNTRFILSVSGMTAFVEVQEKNLGKELNIPLFEPYLKKALADYGFSFTDDVAQADILIELDADVRQGAKVYGLFSAFADFNISLTDLRSGEEIYKNGFTDIKGIQLDFEKAGLKALQEAAGKVDQLMPEILKPLLE